MGDPRRPDVGRFVYGRSYRARNDAVPMDPVHLPLAPTLYETARLDGVFGAVRDAADEGETLVDVCERLTGTRPAPDQIRKLISSLEAAEGEPWELVADDGRQLRREDKALIAKACYQLMTANGGSNPQEDRMRGQVLYGLGISRAQALGDPGAAT